jgi:transcription initiation factor IIE alpha subunit
MELLPPSARLVYKTLESGGLLTRKDIIEKTCLPPRTVQYALTRLRDMNVLIERFYFKDARQSLYGLNAAEGVK